MGRKSQRPTWLAPKDVVPQGEPETKIILRPAEELQGLKIRGATGRIMGTLVVRCYIGPYDRVYPQSVSLDGL